MKQSSTILIVDDAPEGRVLLERLLAAEGYDMAFAGDGVEALAKAATKFEWVVENTDDGYVIVNYDDEVLYANPQARLYLGLAANQDEPVAEKFMILAGKAYQCQPEAAWNAWPDQMAEPAQRYLMQPETASSHAFWLQVDVFPAEPKQTWVVRLRNVTGEVASQRDMRGFHEMVRHKLRTPLIGMQSSLEILARHAAKLTSEEVADMSSRALQSVQRLQGQIDDIVQYLTAPSLAQAEASFNLALLPLVVNEISADLGLKQVMVINQKELDEVHIALSQQAVELIIREILENARKFHP
ncbi:MAG: PAS domain-containing protein, partial [Chloroflexi bacterium]|nr:PAS domain-containing protein [Chloroflexota bacterium]